MIKEQDIAKASTEFDELWGKHRYKDAIKTYFSGGRPFWHSATVSEYLVQEDKAKQAEKEFKYLLRIYRKMKIMPSPEELLAMVKAYSKKKKENRKICKYAEMYNKSCDHYGINPEISN